MIINQQRMQRAWRQTKFAEGVVTENEPVYKNTHFHDYMMEFSDDPNSPLDYSLVCECGDVAHSMPQALARMKLSRQSPLIDLEPGRVRQVAGIMFVVAGMLLFFYAVWSVLT